MRIVVIVAAPREVADLPSGVDVVLAANAAEVADTLRSHDAAVLVTDGFADGDALVQVVKEVDRAVIEVRAERWDGETPSPVSSVCRGVISGFGDAGVVAAVKLLQSG